MPTATPKGFAAEIATRYGRRLRQFLSVRLRNVHDVPDVAQEVFLRLLRVERQDAIRNPEAYLFTVASHVLQQHTLRRSADPVFVDITDALAELATPAGEDPAAKADTAERMKLLERALAQLPPRVAAAPRHASCRRIHCSGNCRSTLRFTRQRKEIPDPRRATLSEGPPRARRV